MGKMPFKKNKDEILFEILSIQFQIFIFSPQTQIVYFYPILTPFCYLRLSPARHHDVALVEDVVLLVRLHDVLLLHALQGERVQGVLSALK